MPNEDSGWDRANGMLNARKDYEQMRAERYREEMALAEKQQPRFIRDNMRTDDIVNGEGMGDWNDRSSLRPGESLDQAKRYSSLGTKALMGRGPTTRRKMGAGMQNSLAGAGGLAQNGNLVMNQNNY